VSGPVVVLASPGASNEALALARQAAGPGFRGAFRVERIPGEQPLHGVPNLALREERAPNVRGATDLGYTETFDQALAQAAQAAAVIVLDDALDGVGALPGRVLYLGTVLPDAARTAEVVLPIANVAEDEGTFTNRDGRRQAYGQAKAAPGMARPAAWVLGELLAALGQEVPA
jgi:NADH dehydrogenase/NADH:ubiquinone oxidoreductase subunit G